MISWSDLKSAGNTLICSLLQLVAELVTILDPLQDLVAPWFSRTAI